MDKVLAFLQSELGRRLLAILLAALGVAGESGTLPLDYPVGSTTTAHLLTLAGIGVATTSGSNSRK